MDYYAPSEFLQSPPAIWRSESSFEPPKRRVFNHSDQTVFADIPGPDLFAEPAIERAGTRLESRRSPTIPHTSFVKEDVATPGVAAAAQHFENSSSSDTEAIAASRVRLLAANYAGGKMSAEIAARLEILDRRMLERAPRITLQHVESLESAATLVDSIKQSLADRRKRLGIVG